MYIFTLCPSLYILLIDFTLPSISDNSIPKRRKGPLEKGATTSGDTISGQIHQSGRCMIKHSALAPALFCLGPTAAWATDLFCVGPTGR